MGTGIIVCGLNGSGKSTVGKALADALGFYFIDHEALCFGGMNTDYTAGRSRRDVISHFKDTASKHADFVFAAVNGMGEKELLGYFQYAVWIRAPKEVRIQRIRERSFQRFGDRMRPGGDLHAKEEAFFTMVSKREEQEVEEWLSGYKHPIIQIDGTRPVSENIELILKQLPLCEEGCHEA
ncbi:MAG: AAA family ATPase [Clostridiales bacterium]|nr:AAA family ATPase [Clostridiales bacterium]